MLFGHSQEVDNSLLISNHQGVAAGVILNGRLAYSRNGNIGELGHIQIDPDGTVCECGKRGCLDTVASSQAVCRVVTEKVAQGEPTILSSTNITMETICSAALEGDELAKQAIEKLGEI